ncbi:MAG: hypothetical protein JWO80_6060, partial [Bryobacterales bacterium]|nr:hypothetical protein [Bryobacterales bacterium]
MRKTFRDFIGLFAAILPMILSAAIVALCLSLAGARAWPWHVWLLLSPGLYLLWLTGYLLICGWICGRLGKKYPKPRYQAMNPENPLASKEDLGIVTAVACYRRAMILTRLPLVSMLEQTSAFRDVVLRAFSPSVHIGKPSFILGVLEDPDLTNIGDSVVIGAGSVISGHAVSMRQDGFLVYLSAPVSIGHRVTVGGNSRIAMGSDIGNDAVIEAGSVLPPFAKIPAGEVWGGSPAVFQRARRSGDSPEASTISTKAVPAEPARKGSDEDARQLVASALRLPPDEVTEDLSAHTCASWDSLGQVAIAAAIFNRFGVAVNAAEVYRISTLPDVANVIAGRGLAHTVEAPRSSDTALPRDCELLPLMDRESSTRALAALYEGTPFVGLQIPVVIAASFTAQPLAPSIKLWGQAFGFDLDCQFAGYNQIVQTLLGHSSEFAANRDGVNVLLLRVEDLSLENEQKAFEHVNGILGAIGKFAAGNPDGSPLLVGKLPPLVSAFTAADPSLIESIRNHWRTQLEQMRGVRLLDFARIVEKIGLSNAGSSDGEAISRVPYSPRVYQELGIELVRTIRASRKSPAKVIAVDCDNTLWGGVLGEVGPDGIALGSDGPGRSFMLFQKRLKALQQKGVLLAVVSRNELAEVRNVFDHHPGMVLRSADIVAWRVNWNHKSENLRDLAQELNLGLESFVFFDDDPAVRLEMQTRVPEVHVIPLPAEPSEYCSVFDRLWLFDGVSATAADESRTLMVQQETARKQELGTNQSLEAFLADLDLRVTISYAGEHD